MNAQTILNYTFDNGQNRLLKKESAHRSDSFVGNLSNRSIGQELFNALSPKEQFQLDNSLLEKTIYDDRGNQLKASKYGLLSYCFLNRLQATVTSSDGVNTTEYNVFIAGGERIKRVTEIKDSNNCVVILKITIYLKNVNYYECYTGQNLIYDGEEVTDNGGKTTPVESSKTLLIREGHRHVVQLEESIINSGHKVDSTRYQWQLDNSIDSCQLILTSEALGIAYFDYTAFGETLSSQHNDTFQNYRYSGEEIDTNSSYHYGYRNYLPENARWSQTDPLGFVDGLNPYIFVKNNPITYRDEKGLMLMQFLLTLFAIQANASGINEGDEISIGEMLEVSSNFLVPEFHHFGFTHLAVERIYKSDANKRYTVYTENSMISSKDVENYDDIVKIPRDSRRRISQYDFLTFRRWMQNPRESRTSFQSAMNMYKASLYKKTKKVKFRDIGMDRHKNTRRTIVNFMKNNKDRVGFFSLGGSHVVYRNSDAPEKAYKTFKSNWNSSKNSFNLLYDLTEGGYNISMLLVNPIGLNENNFNNADYFGQFSEWYKGWYIPDGLKENLLGYFMKTVFSWNPYRIHAEYHKDGYFVNKELPQAYQFSLDRTLLNRKENWNKVKVISHGNGKPTIFQMNAIEYSKRQDVKQRRAGHRELLNSRAITKSASHPRAVEWSSITRRFPGGRYIEGVPYKNRQDYFNFGNNPNNHKWNTGQLIPDITHKRKYENRNPGGQQPVKKHNA